MGWPALLHGASWGVPALTAHLRQNAAAAKRDARRGLYGGARRGYRFRCPETSRKEATCPATGCSRPSPAASP
nr:hypothetical protein RVX_1648 [Nitratidesulfovibrio sp. HK-II]